MKLESILFLLLCAVGGAAYFKYHSAARSQRKEVLGRLEDTSLGETESPTAALFREVGAPAPPGGFQSYPHPNDVPADPRASAAVPPPPVPSMPSVAPDTSAPQVAPQAPPVPPQPAAISNSAPDVANVSAPVDSVVPPVATAAAGASLAATFGGIRLPASLHPVPPMPDQPAHVAFFAVDGDATTMPQQLDSALRAIGAETAWLGAHHAQVRRDADDGALHTGIVELIAGDHLSHPGAAAADAQTLVRVTATS